MRAVFSVTVPPKSANQYPNNAEFTDRMKVLGWEDTKIAEYSEEDKSAWYQAQAEKHWEEMPEIAHEEKDYVIFYGMLQDDQTKFIITRVIEGQATFRLIQPNLDRLQTCTD